MMKILAVLTNFCFLWSSSCFGQRIANSYDCELLAVAMNDNQIKTLFYVETRKQQPIILYDNSNFFPRCKSIAVNGIKIEVEHDEKKYRTSVVGTPLVITSVKREDNTFKLNLYDPATSVEAMIFLKRKDRKYVIEKRESSAFIDDFQEEKD